MKDKKIKALWLATWYPHPGQPTLGIFTNRDAEAMAPYCELAVVSAFECEEKNYQISATISPAGFWEVRVFFPKTQAGRKFLKVFRLMAAYFKGFHFLRKEGFEPNLVHLHVIYPAGLAALWFHWRYRLPLVISENWSGYGAPEVPFSGFQKWLARLCTANASFVLAVTQAMAEAMKRRGLKGRFVVNPNVVNTDFKPLPSRRSEEQKFRFIHVSSLYDEHKNISGLLQAVKKLAFLRQDLSVLILGGDEGTAIFEQLTRELALESVVQFTGVLPHPEVMQFMSESDAFVMFSNREGLPCVLLEAMSVGLPVISTALPGLEDWVTPETGILVPIGDEDALVPAMTGIMENRSLYNSDRIRKVIVEKCSYEVVGQKIMEVYRQALDD